MKKYIWRILLLSCVLLNNACTKIEDDEADLFVGTYTVSTIENVTWGGSYGTVTDNGIFRISKVSSNRVRVSGYFNTYGNVIGSSLYLDSYTSSDYAGSSTIVFGTGFLNGNILNLTSTTNGFLDGYAFFSSAKHNCIKQ
jgi:hypothetical protein